MNRFADTWRSIWHALSSNDRHATYDSPYRTGQHVPLPQSRHAPLTSIATSAIESRVDLDASTDPIPPSATDSKAPSVNGRTMSPSSPYSPGMRSAQRRVESLDRERKGSLDKSPATDIQMQNFAEGLPPPPPVSHSWRRIERWLEDNYGELLDNICEPATLNDVNELEHELDCTLPPDVRDSIQIHDGQERGGRPTGLLFGCMLLDCEEIVEEWGNWRAVNEQYLINQPPSEASTPQVPVKAFAPTSASSSTPVSETQSPKSNGLWREELMGKQDSVPPNSVQKAYAHRSWIPMARDWGGNCLAVDLAPGPMGKWGQVILFGRDYDCKFVVARSWGAFLAILADDLTSGSDKVFVDEENGDLKLQLFKKQGVEPPYFDILRWRSDQRFGRRAVRKRGSGSGSPGLRINPNVQGPAFDGVSASSPYASPTSTTERGRSPHRPNGKSPMMNSPMRPHVSSPLARVAEESAGIQPLSVRTDSDTLKGPQAKKADKLISVDTPRHSADFPAPRLVPTSTNNENQDPVKTESAPAGTKTMEEPAKTTDGAAKKDADPPADEMKTIAI